MSRLDNSVLSRLLFPVPPWDGTEVPEAVRVEDVPLATALSWIWLVKSLAWSMSYDEYSAGGTVDLVDFGRPATARDRVVGGTNGWTVMGTHVEELGDDSWVLTWTLTLCTTPLATPHLAAFVRGPEGEPPTELQVAAEVIAEWYLELDPENGVVGHYCVLDEIPIGGTANGVSLTLTSSLMG